MVAVAPWNGAVRFHLEYRRAMQILLGEDAQPVRFGAWLQKSVPFCNVPFERKSELLRLENVNFMLVLRADFEGASFCKKVHIFAKLAFYSPRCS